MRRAVLLVVLFSVLVTVPVGAQTELDRARARATEAAERSDAARGRADEAQQRADEAVAELESAETRLEEIDAQVAATEDRERSTTTRMDELRATLRDQAVQQYVVGQRGRVAVLVESDLTRAMRTQMLLRVITLGTGQELDVYRELEDDLSVLELELSGLRVEQADAVGDLAVVVDVVDRELATITSELEEAERQEASFRAEVSKLEEEERRRLEEERRRKLEEEARRREEQRRREVATAPTGGGSSNDSGSGGSGGSTSGGGGQSAAPARPPASSGGGGFLCPVAGPVSFTDSWGASRSGGRSHKGVDMFAARGTPVVAPVGGVATLRSVSLGGLSFFLDGDNGDTYFGTHLDSYGTSGRVSAGTVLGYVGNTGNARTASPHLHFEIHPGGFGGAVNPYPTVRAAC